MVRRFLASYPASEVNEFFSHDAVYIDGPRGVHRGTDAIQTEFQTVRSMAPNVTVDIKALAVSGSTVLTERVDSFEINGEVISFEVVGIFDFGSGGRITRWRDYYDWTTFQEQIRAALAAHG
ncbi:nuclear transport factor 2 family protein [Mycobacterium sp. PDNC021]|uniref:nuclear transport factor 2 family protein n=1 Tax=Mycobacterium sp. PDNC021 TaxID=3391399 RepID=UPI003AB0B48F